MDFFSRANRFLGGPILIAVLFTIGVAALAAIEGLLYSHSAAGHIWLVGVIALIGFFLGTIYATDPRDGFAVQDRPIVRTVVSSAVGALLAVIFGSSTPAAVLCGAVFGLLGWLGMRWARYVDF